jgi:hypothetical protein
MLFRLTRGWAAGRTETSPAEEAYVRELPVGSFEKGFSKRSLLFVDGR